MRPALPAALLALCCVLAGCNAFAPGATADRPMPSVTPADVPDGAPDRLAPGLTDDTLANASALFEAHRAVLENRTVVVEQASRATAANGTRLYEQTITYRYAANRSHMSAAARNLQAGYGDAVDLWANETSVLYRYGDGDDSRYRRREGSTTGSPADRLRYELGGVFERANAAVETRYLGERDGYDRYRVRIARAQGDAPPTTFVVDERGFVSEVYSRRSTSLSYEGGAVEDATVASVLRYSFADGPLERPAWVADAREAIASREFVAPGVTSDGVVDVNAFRSAHRDVVENASVTYVSERREVTADGTVRAHTRRTVRLSDDPIRYSSTDLTERDGQTYREERWANASVSYSREGVGNRTEFYRSGGTARRHSVPSIRFSGAIEFHDADVGRLDDGRYRLVVDDYRMGVQYGDVRGAVRNGTLLVVFDGRGFVSRITRTYTVENDESVTKTTETVRYTDLGETAVERPDWLPTAIDETRVSVGDGATNVTTATAVPTE